MESSLKILLKKTKLKSSLQLKQKIMKAINTATEVTIINDKIIYANDKNSTLVFTLLNKDEKLELLGFTKVQLEGNILTLTK